MNNNKNDKAFEIEEKRKELVDSKNYVELKKTYSGHFAELKDFNSPSLWDKLNMDSKSDAKSNPMAWDRAGYISKEIIKKAGNILNVGFGPCTLEKRLGNRALSVFNWFGIDISKTSVSLANINKFGNFQVGKVENIPFTNNFFDVVVASEVLEHIPPSKTFKALSEIYRVLKSNGTLIISVPLNEPLEEMMRQGINPNAHLRLYSEKLIISELRLSSFKVQKSKKLYAFNKNYKVKKIFTSIFQQYRKPNNVIIVASKI